MMHNSKYCYVSHIFERDMEIIKHVRKVHNAFSFLQKFMQF